MVLLTTTPLILETISTLPPNSTFHSQYPSSPSTTSTPANSISHNALITLSKHSGKALNTLLRGTSIYKPPPEPKPEPSEEYKALMERLRVEQERKEYNLLIKQREEQSQQALSGKIGVEDEDGSDDISPSLVLNMSLSVAMCAWVAWHVTRWWPNDGIRVLVALGTALVVGIAEVAVYAAYLRKVEESRRKERRRKEKKEVIGEYTDEGDAVDAWGTRGGKVSRDDTEVEQSEIWGRGVHGGMRRRVREKWEREQEALVSKE